MTRMIRMTRTRMLVGILASALLLAGCSSGPTRDDGRVTLRFQSLAWQQESVEATKELVDEWNALHPDIRVEYVQGSWDSVHDQLLTSFEGGEAPDIVHDASDDLADFAYGGHLADLTELLPERLTSDIPALAWQSVTFGDGVYGVPFLQEPRVLIADAARLRESGVRVPTPEHPWSWDEFREVTKELSGDGRYGVAWPLKEPVSATLNLSLSAGGRLFHRDAGGKVTVRFEEGDEVVPRTIHEQVNTDRSASPTTLGSAGGLRHPARPLRGHVRDGAARLLVPPADRPAGAGGLRVAGAARTGRGRRTRPGRQPADAVRRRGLPAQEGGRGLPRLSAPAAEHGAPGARRLDAAHRPPGPRRPGPAHPEHGWATGTALAARLRPAPAQSVRGYPEWKDKVATPALQEYYSGAIGLDELRKRLEKDGNLVLARYQR